MRPISAMACASRVGCSSTCKVRMMLMAGTRPSLSEPTSRRRRFPSRTSRPAGTRCPAAPRPPMRPGRQAPAGCRAAGTSTGSVRPAAPAGAKRGRRRQDRQIPPARAAQRPPHMPALRHRHQPQTGIVADQGEIAAERAVGAADAALKVAQGVTSLEEIIKVAPPADDT